MEPQLQAVISQLHARPIQYSLAITGGGSQAAAWLLAVPGASRRLLEVRIPYAAAALTRYLGAPPEQYCSSRTARAMAMTAFWQGQELSSALQQKPVLAIPSSSELLGLGCTASLASDRPKRGDHRAYLAVQARSYTQTTSLILAKGARDRLAEEYLVSRLIVDRLLQAAAVEPRAELSLTDGDRLTQQRTDAPADWQRLLAGELAACCTDGRQIDTGASVLMDDRVVVPGAFHPLHVGHRQLAAVAAEMTSRGVEFEISVKNVDKPPLDYTEIAARLEQFHAEQPVWLSRAATFLEKARLFRGAVFAVGADTLLRIADPRYYGGDAAACRAACQEIAGYGCRFLVFGRLSSAGFLTLADLDLPEPLGRICQAVPAERFRVDLSSSELRSGTDTPE